MHYQNVPYPPRVYKLRGVIKEDKKPDPQKELFSPKDAWNLLMRTPRMTNR